MSIISKAAKKVKKVVLCLCLLFTAAFLVVAYTPVTNYMARPLTMESELQRADIIAVLGGGAYRNGVLSRASNERLIQGLLLYREGYAPGVIFLGGSILEASGKLLHTLSGSEDTEGMDVVEAAFMRRIAVGLGIPGDDMYVDSGSTNTYTNIRALKEFMESGGLASCLLVTSPTHMYRAMRVAGRQGLECSPAPVKDYTHLRRDPTDRVALLREVLWEYAALILYRVYGYI